MPPHVCLIPDPLQRPPFPSDSALQCCRPVAIVPPILSRCNHSSLPHCMTCCHALHQDATLYMVLLTFPLKPGRPSSCLRCPHLCGGKRNSQPLAHAFACPCLLNTFFPMCGPRPSFLTPFQIVPPVCQPCSPPPACFFSKPVSLQDRTMNKPPRTHLHCKLSGPLSNGCVQGATSCCKPLLMMAEERP